ncbi:MAG: hypothetical protein ACR2O7_01375 [Parasphingorhabdus sp.]
MTEDPLLTHVAPAGPLMKLEFTAIEPDWIAPIATVGAGSKSGTRRKWSWLVLSSENAVRLTYR